MAIIRSFTIRTLLIVLAIILAGCTSNDWKAQTCYPLTNQCGSMNYGPYKTVDECIEKMKNIGWGFNCGYSCSSDESSICKKVLRYTTIEKDGVIKVIPNSSNP